MNVKQLVTAISNETEHNPKVVEAIIRSFIGTVQKSLIAGESVKLQGIGTFERKLKSPRHGRNINEDKMVQVPPCYAPGFKMSETLRRRFKDLPIPKDLEIEQSSLSKK